MDYKIVIDAGHGGNDSGVVDDEIVEKEYTLMISQYMKERFDELGINANLVRNYDETLTPKERVDKVNSLNESSKDIILISNHLGSNSDDSCEIVYALRDSEKLSKIISEEFIKEGQSVKKYYQRRLPNDPSKDYHSIIRDTANIQPILIEYSIFNGDRDENNQIKIKWKEYVESVIKAIAKYINKPYIPIIKDNSFEYYTVKKGDTLWSISKKYNVTVEELKDVNNLTSNLIKIGEQIKIPKSKNKLFENDFSYTVKKGDTLYGIGNKFNINIEDIMEENSLTSPVLSVGQVLSIGKAKKDECDIHEVVTGDTLYSLAKKYNIRVQDIINENNLKSTALLAGQKLIIPIK